MFRPFYIFIGWRYARSQKKQHFSTFISLISVIGIALGVTVLITVLSVMNGFRTEIQKSILSTNPEIIMHLDKLMLSEVNSLIKKIKNNENIIGAAPFINGYALIMAKGKSLPIMVRGINENYTNEVFALQRKITSGSINNFFHEQFGVVISDELARTLNVKLGDKLSLLIPEALITPQGAQPRSKRFIITSIYKTNTNFDKQYIFINLNAAQKLYRNPELCGIEMRIHDGVQANIIAKQLTKKFNYAYWFSDWTEEFANFLQAINMEKTVMTCILFLIVMVAVFNLVSSLFMIVTDKRKDIAILRAMGASCKDIMYIFIIQGFTLGTIGSICGLFLGLLLAYNVTEIVAWIQRICNVSFINSDIYWINYVPSIIHMQDVLVVVFGSLGLSLIATIYPALKAANISPAEALRYE